VENDDDDDVHITTNDAKGASLLLAKYIVHSVCAFPWLPFLPDWFYGLSDHLMFLFRSTAGFVHMVCQTKPALSWFSNALKIIALRFHFISRLMPDNEIFSQSSGHTCKVGIIYATHKFQKQYHAHTYTTEKQNQNGLRHLRLTLYISEFGLHR